MQIQRVTDICRDAIKEILLSMKASEEYERYRLYDDIFYLPEHDRAWFYCVLALHKRITGRELLPNGKTKAPDSVNDIDISDIDIRGLLKTLNKEKRK